MLDDNIANIVSDTDFTVNTDAANIRDIDAYAEELFKYAETLPDAPTWFESARIPDREPSDITYTSIALYEKDIDGVGGVIVWQESPKCFMHFASHSDLRSYVLALPTEKRVLYEKCYENQPQKLRFDIDGLSSITLQDISEITDAIVHAFLRATGELLMGENIIICDSSDENKKSIHIIIAGYYVNSNEDARAFAKMVTSELSPKLVSIIDMNIYNRGVGLRLPYNHKLSANTVARTKKIVTHGIVGEPFMQCLITYTVDCKEVTIPGTVTKEADKYIVPTGEIASIVAQIPEQYLEGLRFRNARGIYVNFDRTAASKCPISGKVHCHDNTVFAIITSTVLLIKCRHCSTGSINLAIDSNVVKVAEKKKKISRAERIEQSRARITQICGAPTREYVLNTQSEYKYTGAKNNHGDYMDDLDVGAGEHSLLFVRAAMGTGKTNGLMRYREKVKPSSVLAISFRLSFTSEMCVRMGLKSYRMIDKRINKQKSTHTILQCESLYRMDLEPYDMLILDEVESIINQCFSPTHKNARLCWLVFEYLLKSCKRVVCMDANLSQATIDIISAIRKTPSHLHINGKTPATTRHQVTTNFNFAIANVMRLLKDNQRLVIPTSSRKVAERIELMIRKKYPDLRILIYTSKTPEAVKNKDFENVNEAWRLCDVLIYSPTVLCGISFTLQHFESCCSFFFDSSCDVYSCMQMLWRCRHICTGRYYHYISETTKDLPDNIEAVLKYVGESFAHAAEYNIPELIANDDGSVVVPQTSRVRAWALHTARKNASRNQFLRTFVNELKLIGGEVTAMEQLPDEFGDGLGREMNNYGREIADAEADAIIAAGNLSADEYDFIIAVGAKNHDESLAIAKENFRRFYHFEGELTRDILLKYSKDRVRAQYIRRKRLRGFDGAEEALEAIGRQFFAAAHKGFDVEHFKQLFDINRDRICINFLRMFGAKLGEPYPRLTKLQLVDSLKTNYDTLVGECALTCKLFGVKRSELPRRDSDNFTKGLLEYINGKLDVQYGLKIKASNGKALEYVFADSFNVSFDNDFAIKT